MSGGHAHPLYRPGSSLVHRLPAHVKLVAALVVVLAVVATPREAFGVFALHFLLLVVVWVLARLSPSWIASRALVELPFVVLVVLLPFAAGEPRTEVAGLSLSVEGLLVAWNILVKGTLGVLTSVTLAATTPMRDLVAGLSRLRVPPLVTVIATLMLRYLEVIAAEARRMRLARLSRGDDPRFLWQLGATVRGLGTLFLRSYERGERVHLAMLSRGYTGAMPAFAATSAMPRQWVGALGPGAVAVALAVTGYLIT